MGDEPNNITGAAFNFAIATLMRIDELLKDIKKVSVVMTGEAQHVKHKLCRQVLVNACALIKDKTQETSLMGDLDKINPKIAKTVNSAGMPSESRPYYDSNVDKDLDLFLMKVSNVLQEEGNYFMPDRIDDEGL